MIRKIEHIGIKVQDMNKSIRFYTDVLRMQLVRRVPLRPGVELSFLSFPGQEDVQVELIGSNHTGLSNESIVHHLAFTVSDIHEEVNRLKRLGVELIDQQPKTILDGDLIFFFYGPDGEQLEFFQPIQAATHHPR